MRHEKKNHGKCQNCGIHDLSSYREHHWRDCSTNSKQITVSSSAFDPTIVSNLVGDSSLEDK